MGQLRVITRRMGAEGRPDGFVVLAEWATWMKANSYAETTRHHYAYTMAKFLMTDGVIGTHPLEVTYADVAVFIASLGDKAHSKSLHVRGLRCFYGWAGPMGYVDTDPTSLVKPKRPRRDRPQPFHHEELTRLVIAAANRDPRRAWAMLACYALGTRRMEICGLRPRDIDWLAGKVYLRSTKGAKPRDVPIGGLAGEALHQLEALYRGGPTLLGIQPSTFTGWVNQAAQDCGFPVGRKRRAHTLRSTFATDLDRAGVSGRIIQELLGHESLATTTVYIGVNDTDLQAAVEVPR